MPCPQAKFLNVKFLKLVSVSKNIWSELGAFLVIHRSYNYHNHPQSIRDWNISGHSITMEVSILGFLN